MEIAFLQRILYLTKRSHTNDLSYIVFQRKMLMSEIDFFKIMTTVKFYKVYFIYSILSIHTRLNSLDLLHSSKYITEHEHVYVCHRQTARLDVFIYSSHEIVHQKLIICLTTPSYRNANLNSYVQMQMQMQQSHCN